MMRHGKPLALVALLSLMLLAVALLPVREWLTAGVAWIEGQGVLAWIVYVLVYVIATVLVMPGSIFTLGAGFIFGLPVGVALVSVSSVLGATCAFLVGRFLARDWIAQRVAKLPRFNALDKATRHEGFVIVLLARLSPLFPFNILNYALSLTAVRLTHYVLASWIGMLPATIAYVYIGSVALDLTELASGEIRTGMVGRVLLIIGLVATLALTILITRKATGALTRHLDRELAGTPEG